MTTDDQNNLENGISAIAEHYQAVEPEEEHSMDKLQQSLSTVAREFTRICIEHKAHLNATKDRFNLFTVLWPKHFEVQLHTRYLIHLLNPRESVESHHDCDKLFLRLFIEMLKFKRVGEHSYGNKSPAPALGEVLASLQKLETVSVGSKNTSRYGNLDILIECPGWGAIVIENKIDAKEQYKQLATYEDYLQEEHIRHGRKGILLYLTLEGTSSGTANGPYYTISYRNHILPWLEECLRATYKYVNINQALQQYKKVLQQILHIVEREDMDKYVEILKDHTAIIEHWAAITKARDELRTQCMDRFFKDLGAEIEKNIPGFQIEKAEEFSTACSGLFAVDAQSNAAECCKLRTVVKLFEDGDVYVYLTPDGNSTCLSKRDETVFALLHDSMEKQRVDKWPNDFSITLPMNFLPWGGWYVACMDETEWHTTLRAATRKEFVEGAAKKVTDYVRWANEGWRKAVVDAGQSQDLA